MPPRSTRPQFPGHLVTTVLVSHDGARWLPGCLAALSAQTQAPQRVVAVDTGSSDSSPRLLADSLGASAVLELPPTTSLGAAVQAGLHAFAGAPAPPDVRSDATEWVWVLHDDCVPDPTALAELLALVDSSPSVSVAGPKLLTPDGRHLREVGVTIDSSGRRQSGLEPHEVDQGQHDDISEVLAVSTAGMLVRRDVWDSLGGLDTTWPLFAEDLDFGWRVNASGGRVVVATRAVLRHAGALLDGVRRADAVAGRPGAASRRNGMQVVLANTAPVLVLPLALRYVAEAVVRALVALLLLRSPGDAVDELLAMLQVLGRPATVLAARRRRRPHRLRTHRELHPLLAPAGLRWRAVTETVAAAFGGSGRERLRQPARRPASVETGPVAEEAESLELGTDLLHRLFARPGVLLGLALVALALIADRHLLGGTLHGGRLLAAPAGAADLWSAYTASWHPVGLGSGAAAPPWLAVLAAASVPFLGKPWLLVDVLMLGAVPLAGVSAYLASGAVTRSARLRVWAAVTYSVLPVVTGAVAGGRLDVVVASILLPPLARAVAAAVTVDRRTRGWHRCAGAGLLLAVVAAFAPFVWVLAAAALVLAVASVAAGRPIADTGRRFAASGALLVVAPIVLLPWTITVVRRPALLLAGTGLPETFASRLPQRVEQLLLLHPGGPAQPPLWVLAPVVALAVVALARTRRRAASRAGFAVFVAGAAAALAQSRLSGVSSAGPQTRYWVGVALAVASLGALVASLAAADGAAPALARYSFGWRQPVAGLLAVAAVAGPAVAMVAWLSRGADGPLTDRNPGLLPVFAAAEVALPSRPRVLAMRSDAGVVRYALIRRPTGPRLGDADLAAAGGSTARRLAAARLADAVRAVSAGRPTAAERLAEFGIGMLVIPEREAAQFDRLADVEGLTPVSATGAVVYRVGASVGELVVTAAPGDPSAGAVRPIPLSGDRGVAPPGPAGRLLVLAEPADGRWTARLDGHRLPATRAYGWAQAWTLPAAGGRLTVSHDSGHRGGWLAGELAALVVAALLALPNRRLAEDRQPEPVPLPEEVPV